MSELLLGLAVDALGVALAALALSALRRLAEAFGVRAASAA